MESELQQFENERGDRVRQLHEKNKREMEEFDKESMEKGIRFDELVLIEEGEILMFGLYIFSAIALAEASKETYPDEEGSLSGSMLSLAHSNSSTSFPAGSL